MIPATFTITALLASIILAAAGAPLLVLYVLLGIALIWQFAVALVAGAAPPSPIHDETVTDDPTEGLDIERG
jgi:hypothetical protein